MEIETAVAPLSHVPVFAKYSVLDQLFTIIDEEQIHVAVEPHENGVEMRFLNEIGGTPNRGRLRIFFPAENKCCLFFYKKSSIPYSRDRFSYGGIVVDERSGSRFDESEIREWVRFLLNGFQPKFRPRSLKKSIPYTVPED